jgi:hypothetical protein
MVDHSEVVGCKSVEFLMIQELTLDEVDQVSGAGLAEALGYVIGLAMGAGATMQQSIDATANPMLGALQYGA